MIAMPLAPSLPAAAAAPPGSRSRRARCRRHRTRPPGGREGRSSRYQLPVVDVGLPPDGARSVDRRIGRDHGGDRRLPRRDDHDALVLDRGTRRRVDVGARALERALGRELRPTQPRAAVVGTRHRCRGGGDAEDHDRHRQDERDETAGPPMTSAPRLRHGVSVLSWSSSPGSRLSFSAGPLAQLAEHRAFNPQVPSSSLGRPTHLGAAARRGRVRARPEERGGRGGGG